MKIIIKRLLRVLGILSLIAVGFLAYMTYQFADWAEESRVCTMSEGPCVGKVIDIDLSHIKVEDQIQTGEFTFLFSNISDTLPPKVIKINATEQVLKAWEFGPEDGCSIPHQRWSGFRVEDSPSTRRISFLNESNYEGGSLYLDADYNLEYLCLKGF